MAQVQETTQVDRAAKQPRICFLLCLLVVSHVGKTIPGVCALSVRRMRRALKSMREGQNVLPDDKVSYGIARLSVLSQPQAMPEGVVGR